MKHGGRLDYKSWCDHCQRVTSHLRGECQVCHLIGFPKPAVVLPEVAETPLLSQPSCVQ